MGLQFESTLVVVPVTLVIIFMTIGTQGIPSSPPRIIKQPPSDELLFKVAQQSKESDKPFIIECEAEGEPAPTYEWIKNGKPFQYQVYDNRISQQLARGSLVISSPRDEDMGQYQCFAKNQYGVATSNSVFVRKAELNSFKDDNDRAEHATEGSPFSLKCQPPDGWPKPIVNWLIQGHDGGIKTINNSRMTLDPEGTLWFSNVTREDQSEDFYYACSATSVFRNEYKIGNRVKLVVDRLGQSPSQNRHEPVEQYVSRKNTVAMRGKTAELYCIYGGTPLPQTVWQKNGRPIPWSDRILQGHYGKTLIIRHVSFDDAATYTCEVSNGYGNAKSYSMHLAVQSVPYFTKEPEIVNAAEEESAEFRCEADGVPKPTIIWIHNGKPISEAPYNPRRSVENNRIFIRDLIKNDTGNYGCNATNEHGYVYKDVYLNVLSLPPEILEKPQAVQTVDQKNVTLTCRVFGAPKPVVNWYHDNNSLSGGRFITLDNGDLFIERVAFPDRGSYTCEAKNRFGTATASGSLEVKERTRITEPPEDYEIIAGNTATFRCNAVSDSSLDLRIEWLKDGAEIDFENDARFIKTNDNSLVISQTIELDSGAYTCKAKTILDEASARATLIVQDVPNPPELTRTVCEPTRATIFWEPKGDKRSPILYYVIQYNTSFTPELWESINVNIPSTDFSYTVSLSPWANYTFRVIAYNKIGPSTPSKFGSVCSTQPAVPDKNPDNVEGKGTEPNNMVISWTPMPKIEQNGNNFLYRVYWKLDSPNVTQWQHYDINDWRQNMLMINDTPVFTPYLIKVVAINEVGEANVAAEEKRGYSGEAQPLEAPSNFTLLQVTSATSAVLSWNPVNPESIRGHFKGYKIQTWTQEEGEENYREIHIKNDSTQALVNKFKPNSKNFARVLAFNGRYNGPPSVTIDFDTPEGVPSAVQLFDGFPLGSSALLLQWKPPLYSNGRLTGYRIYFQQVNGTAVAEKRSFKEINNPRATQAKLSALEPNSKYRISIVATTSKGEGEEYFIERTTNPTSSATKPDTPDFEIQQVPDQDAVATKIIWKPPLHGNKTGSHFMVQYRKRGEQFFNDVLEKNNDFSEIIKLDPYTQYEIRVLSIDGNESTPSQIRIYDTSNVENPIKRSTNDNIAEAGWFIGMMLALAIIILLLIIVCIIRRNRGGKYDVHDREMANGRRDYPEEGGFHEYSQPLDNKSTGRQSVSSHQLKPESDTDSMAEYGDGDTGQFTEDGSFIGQYVPGKLQPPVSPQPVHSQSQSNNAVATYV